MDRSRARATRRSSPVVLALFVVAVLTLAILNEPLLLPRARSISFASFAAAKKKKDRFPFPDFDKYIHTQTLSPTEFGLGTPGERVIVIGDTHGMNHSFHNLLDAVRYNRRKDTLLLTGDILAKSTEAGSLALLDFFAQQKLACAKDVVIDSSRTPRCKPVYAVRGNHDQMIVQWRAWRDWFAPLELAFPSTRPHPRRPQATARSSDSHSGSQAAAYEPGPPVGTGSQFLALIEAEWHRDRANDPTGAGSDVEEWVDTVRKRAAGTWREEWWRRIPQPGKGRAAKDWIMFGDHYWIARDMKPEHAQFLFSLPLVIHVPSEHLFLVHAGLLPFDPRRPSNDKHQPLAHAPSSDDFEDNSDSDSDYLRALYGDDYGYEHPLLDTPAQHALPRASAFALDDETEELRVVQERSLLHDVPQNRDAWAVLNMRGIRKNGKITRQGDRGTPWAKLWNRQMRRCGGFDDSDESSAHALAKKRRAGDRDEWSEEGEDAAAALPCYPSTVVYGHAASRDLDVRRWTVGLDTGCLYGRRLTALVLTSPRAGVAPSGAYDKWDEEDNEEDGDGDESSGEEEDDELESTTHKAPKTWTRKIKFGDKDAHLGARLVSVKCPKVADLS